MIRPASPPAPAPSREERLAAKLRENLRRRKAQARALAPGQAGVPEGAGAGDESAGALSKPDPSR